MGINRYYSGYYASKEREKARYEEIRSKKTKGWSEETDPAAKRANFAKHVEKLEEKRQKASKTTESDPNDVKVLNREAVRQAVERGTGVPDPNTAFRAQKGRRSVYDYQADVKRVVERMSPNKGNVYHSTESFYHNPGPGKVWNPVAEEWEEMGGGADMDEQIAANKANGIKSGGNTPWPEDQTEEEENLKYQEMDPTGEIPH